MRGKYCYLILFLTFTTAFGAPPKRSGKPKTTSCGLTKLMANALTKEFTSPGYPGEFPEQTQCTWLIHAPRGFRVKAKLRDFYLLNQNSNCKMQYLLFTDDYTGKKYGPLCGKMPKEEIISSANTLRIKLESDSVDIGIPYRGFKFTYTQTTEPTSEVLRDKAGLWRKYFVPSATVAPSLMPTDDTIDDNDNESINRRNQLKNLKNDKANDE
uniref:membrane frizzled-related protein-like isoform X2 n=1 Tax=Styela clava TaxID=7725 RepID=UPI00193A1C0B|nr:membrane frizzled-related protein-like isoform X2 [Styela clava]XP_039261029.1 membrane frizzled-related protein-like isoform X2 [Styela clava]